jgi:hypothetical protein
MVKVTCSPGMVRIRGDSHPRTMNGVYGQQSPTRIVPSYLTVCSGGLKLSATSRNRSSNCGNTTFME